ELKTISIVLPVQLGAYVMSGSTRFSGLESVEETYLQELVPWESGEEFNNGALEEYRRKLVTSGLFTSVRVSSAGEEDLSDNDNLGVDIALDEAAHRTIGAGAKYSRDRGFGGSVFWEHRNLLGQAE